MEYMIEKSMHVCFASSQSSSGLLPPRTLENVNLFDVVHIGIIGPYKYGSYGITMIDQATRWIVIYFQINKMTLATIEILDR